MIGDGKRPHDCMGGYWTEARAVLMRESADLRLQAARLSRANAPGDAYGNWTTDFNDLNERAARLDQIAVWLADRMELPAAPEPGDVLVHYDDGSSIALDASAGGAAEGGAWSWLRLVRHRPDLPPEWRVFKAEGEWKPCL